MTAPGPALPVAPQGESGIGGATTPPGSPCEGCLEAAGGLPAPALAPNLPPVPPARLLAALQRARAALRTRQAQLAACRTCGAEAAAYDEAAADLDTLTAWLRQL